MGKKIYFFKFCTARLIYNNIFGIIYTNPRSKEVALAKNYIIRRNYHDVSRNRYSPYC